MTTSGNPTSGNPTSGNPTSGKPRRRAIAASVSGLVIGAILMGIEAARGTSLRGVIGGVVIIVAYSAALYFLQNRSETIGALAGKHIDERWDSINLKALAFTGTMVALASLGGYAVMEAQGKDNWQFAAMAVVTGASYIAGIVWFRSRA